MCDCCEEAKKSKQGFKIWEFKILSLFEDVHLETPNEECSKGTGSCKFCKQKYSFFYDSENTNDFPSPKFLSIKKI
jgi:hypothetical protein